MSLRQLFSFATGSATSRNRTRRQSGSSASRKRRLGFECVEGRLLLTAVVIDRSTDPSADTIYVGQSGSNTVVDVNGTQVESIASSAISSLNIYGTAYNDTIEFDYSAGNPVPNGSIGVYGNGGQNQLDVWGNSDFTLASYVQLWGNISSIIGLSSIQSVVASASSTSDVAYVEAGTSSAGTFFGHLATGPGAGPGSNYQGNDGSYNNIALGFGSVTGISGNSADSAQLDDSNAGTSNVTAHPTSSFFSNGSYTVTANSFSHVSMTSSYGSTDFAYLDDQNSSSAATVWYQPLNCTYTGSGYDNQVFGFGHIQMNGDNSSDVVQLNDAGAPGTFTSTYTNSYVLGTINGSQYAGNAFFRNVFLAASYNTDQSAWNDPLGGASVALNSSSDPYIIFSNGYAVTDIGFVPPSGPNPVPDINANNQTNPAKLDYANASALSLVTLNPKINNQAYWYVNYNQ
ncbi:MAG TPA: hypothetical protein VFI31_09595 [Pirellulales bacterium]|nr:hypothetical protein [Pirellulales bacterium]